jgi:hypothetical protein
MLWSGGTGGLVAWNPPHRQDEDLVPLTAGACSPRRRSSRQVPRQTSGPDSSPHDSSGAASRRHRAPYPNLAQMPLPGGRLLGLLGEAALGCDASVPSRFGPPPGHALKSRPGSRPAYRSFERLDHCHRRTGQRPIRPAVPDRLVGRCRSEGRAASAGRSGLATLQRRHESRGSPRVAQLGGLWPWWLAIQHRPGSRPG